MSQSDEPPIAFFRVGWMSHYDGVSAGDKIRRGGSYVEKEGFGHEIFNFRPYRGRMYGYVQPPSRNREWEHGRINIQRLGAPDGATSISGVLIVWVSTSTSGGAYVVGWYENATVHAGLQESPQGADRKYAGARCGYFAEVRATDAVLLSSDERVCSIPQSGKGSFGQSNIWFADDAKTGPVVRAKVREFIRTHRLPRQQSQAHHRARQNDVSRRQEVERIAVKTVIDRFELLGYSVDSVEADKCGWDLTATLDRRQLRLEVKGLSGEQIAIELTPNEYKSMRRLRTTYRICVVTNALNTPRLRVFAYSPDSGAWESDGRDVLVISEVVAARCAVK